MMKATVVRNYDFFIRFLLSIKINSFFKKKLIYLKIAFEIPLLPMKK